MSMTRQGEAYLCLYSVRRESFSDVAADDFVESVLHALADWLARMRARPATGVVGTEQVIVEWTGGAHVIHKLTIL